jgi:hypothetical protein
MGFDPGVTRFEAGPIWFSSGHTGFQSGQYWTVGELPGLPELFREFACQKGFGQYWTVGELPGFPEFFRACE